MKNKISKILIAFLSLVLIVGNFAHSPDAYAFNYPKIEIGKEVSGELEDYWGGIYYELILNESKKISISYSGMQKSDFYLYDNKLNTIFSSVNVTKLQKSITLSKGNYVFSIYNRTYDKGSYKLLIKDKTKYLKNLSFAQNIYYMDYGTKIKPVLVKSPSGSNAKGVVWTSTNTNVATVNKYGRVQAVGMGKTTLIARLKSGKQAVCSIYVNKTNINVFKNTTKKLPKLNGKRVQWTSSNTSVAKTLKNSVKGVSKGNVSFTKYEDNITYTVNVTVTAAKRLVNVAKAKIKSSLPNNRTLIIFHAYRGYDKNGNACVVLDYGEKSGSKLYSREYFICYYNRSFALNYYSSSIKPILTKLKEI